MNGRADSANAAPDRPLGAGGSCLSDHQSDLELGLLEMGRLEMGRRAAGAAIRIAGAILVSAGLTGPTFAAALPVPRVPALAAGVSPQETGGLELPVKDAPKSWLLLPDDPLGRLWASVGPETLPWRPDVAPDAGSTTWTDWAGALGALGIPGERREALATLSRIAREDGRSADAFAWLLEHGADDPGALAGAVPALFPGVPVGSKLLPGGRPAPLPESITLAPQFPPRSQSAVRGALEPRRASAFGLQVGEAVFDLELKLDGSGVVADLTHTGGGTATLRVALAAPAGYRLKSLYIDWGQLAPPEGSDPATYDWAGRAVEVKLEPREDELTIFARLEKLKTPFPASPAPTSGLSFALANAGLVMDLPEDAPARWDAVAAAWSKALGTGVLARRAAAEGAGASGSAGIEGVVLRFRSHPDPEGLRRRVTSAIEARLRPAS